MYSEMSIFQSFEDLNKTQLNSNNKYLILVTEDVDIDLEYLNMNDIDYNGVILPKLIDKNKLLTKAIFVITLEEDIKVEFIDNMREYTNPNDFFDCKSLITFVDGFSDCNTDFLEKIFESMKLNTNIIGGGAGCFKNSSRKMFFNKNGFYKDSALLIFLDKKINLGVGLGWNSFTEPLVATKCNGKKLSKIGFSNALNVYKNIVEKESGEIINEDNFYDIAKKYPLGVIQHNNQTILRDLISFNSKGELILAGDIEDNTIFNILKAQKQDLIKDTKKACKEVKIKKSEIVMVFECISRIDYLDDEYDSHMDMIFNEAETNNILGAVCVGEIANKENRYINLLNKSCVIGGICH